MIFKKKILLPIIAVLFFIILIFLVLFFRNQSASVTLKSVETTTSFSKPAFFGLARFFDNIFSANYLSRRNQFLEEETKRLRSLLLDNDNLQKENNSLKAALKISTSENLTLEPAQVIFFDVSGLKNTAIINKGSNSGLKEGMNVILPDKILVGRLIKVLPDYAQIETIYGPKTSLGAEILTSHILGLAERNTQGSFYFKLYPADVNIQLGDIVVTSVENSGFYRGLIIGEISDQGQNDINKKMIKEAFKISDLNQVLVIKNQVF